MQLLSIQFNMLAGLRGSGIGEMCAYTPAVGKSESIGFDAPVGDDRKDNYSATYKRLSYIWT